MVDFAEPIRACPAPHQRPAPAHAARSCAGPAPTGEKMREAAAENFAHFSSLRLADWAERPYFWRVMRFKGPQCGALA